MAMGKRRRRPKQTSMWVATQDLPRTAAHPFYITRHVVVAAMASPKGHDNDLDRILAVASPNDFGVRREPRDIRLLVKAFATSC